MVDVRPNQLPSATTVTNTDKLVLDQGAAGVNSASPSELFDVFSPLASQAEAEQGTDNNKRMTPLRTKQSIASEVGTTIASAASGALANSAVQPDRTITAGTGLEGGGDLSVNRTIALNSASQLSLGRANSAIQEINGKTGNDIDLVKDDIGLGNVDNTSDAAKPVSTAQATAIALKANNATTVTAGTGLTGGGDLSANRTVALNATSIASLAKADTALQVPGGVLGQIIVKQSAALNDVAWATSEAATAVSYAPQTLTTAQKIQARENIDVQPVTTTTVGAAIAGANGKQTPADGDFFTGVEDGGSTMFKTTWANIKAALKTYFDTIYQAALGFVPVNKAGDTNLGGFESTVDPLGNLGGTTYTPTKGLSNFKTAANNGAFTITAPAGAGTCLNISIRLTNAASGAGAMTTTGFKVIGTFDTSPNLVQIIYVEVISSTKLLTVKKVPA